MVFAFGVNRNSSRSSRRFVEPAMFPPRLIITYDDITRTMYGQLKVARRLYSFEIQRFSAQDSPTQSHVAPH
jgi:hypothetical protein